MFLGGIVDFEFDGDMEFEELDYDQVLEKYDENLVYGPGFGVGNFEFDVICLCFDYLPT